MDTNKITIMSQYKQLAFNSSCLRERRLLSNADHIATLLLHMDVSCLVLVVIAKDNWQPRQRD